MAPHSSTVAQKIPWMEEPGGLQSMGSLRVGHDWATSHSLSTFMHWRRKWQPTPVFLPGESNGWSSLVGCSPWGRTESDTTEVTWQHSKGYLLLWGKLQKNNLYQITQFKGKGSGTPLQYSWLENPMDGGAWWATVYGVAQSQTRLKWLSSSSSST